MSSFDGIVTYQNDNRPPFIEVDDLDTFWDSIAKIHQDRFNKRGNITLKVDNIIIGDTTYEGPVVLTPEDIEKKHMDVLKIKIDPIK